MKLFVYNSFKYLLEIRITKLLCLFLLINSSIAVQAQSDDNEYSEVIEYLYSKQFVKKVKKDFFFSEKNNILKIKKRRNNNKFFNKLTVNKRFCYCKTDDFTGVFDVETSQFFYSFDKAEAENEFIKLDIVEKHKLCDPVDSSFYINNNIEVCNDGLLNCNELIIFKKINDFIHVEFCISAMYYVVLFYLDEQNNIVSTSIKRFAE